MPRFETRTNQFIVPDNFYTIAAAPSKPKRSSHNTATSKPTHKRKNSGSALERLSAFADATQRVQRRLRCAIAGAVGASASRPKRKSRDAMNVDYVWNGYYEAAVLQASLPSQDTSSQVNHLPNYVPVINRYSVNMEERSISDVSMYFGEQDDSTLTPRANTPEPITPVASPKQTCKKGSMDPNEVKEEAENESDEEEASDGEVVELNAKLKSSAANDEKEYKKEFNKPSVRTNDETASIRSPMDEDPIEAPSTPAAVPKTMPTNNVPLIKTPKPKRRSTVSGILEDTLSLTTLRDSIAGSSPKTPKVSLRKGSIPAPRKLEASFITDTVERVLTERPAGLGLELGAGIQMTKEPDFMDIIPPSAMPSGVVFSGLSIPQPLATRQGESTDIPKRIRPTLLPPVELLEKPLHKPSRKSSRDSEVTVVGSPRDEVSPADKQHDTKDSPISSYLDYKLSRPSALRAKVEALPLEQEDAMALINTPTFHVWPASPLTHRGAAYGRSPLNSRKRLRDE